MSRRHCSHTYISSRDCIPGEHTTVAGLEEDVLNSIRSGECASHFRQILNKFPPQVSTRSNAAAWACHVHNEVNKSLDKELFDCSKIGDFYDCGCAEEDNVEAKKTVVDTGQISLEVERSGYVERGDTVLPIDGWMLTWVYPRPTRGG